MQLPVAVATVTKQSPYELWMGFTPRAHQPDRISIVPALEDQKRTLIKARDDAQKAITHAQDLLRKHTCHQPYHVGQQVWLEGKNLQMTHPTTKLRAKRFGPFKVTRLVGKTSYKLALPPQWKIHNVFHASLLLPYVETEEHGRNFEEPPPELIDGEPEWEVEQILGS